jgi:alcohol dehydrogenase (cytochrome c)
MMPHSLFLLACLSIPWSLGAQEWTVYGGDAASTRFSPLKQIDSANVGRLAVSWVLQTGVPGKYETTPLFENGILYFTGPSGHAWGIDARTGRTLWHFSRAIPKKMGICCGPVNRGFALAGNRLFLVTVDAHVIALDKRTGQLLWDTIMDDYKKGYSATGAPLLVKDKIVVGMAGGDYANRGFLDAYSLSTGERIWRIWTTPGPGEPGSETWQDKKNLWQSGGGSTWVTGSYDPQLNLVYWGTGNPGPDLIGDVRPGDNLYTNSMLAVDADSGKLKWFFQFTPHDTHDWDAVSEPILADVEIGGAARKILLQANRNGFLYALDRATGKFIYGVPFVHQTWAKGLDAAGRPILVPGMDPTTEGKIVCPSLSGGKNWNHAAYNPDTGLIYVPSSEGCEKFMIDNKVPEPDPLRIWLGSYHETSPETPQWGAVRAFDARDGKLVWEFKTLSPQHGSMLTTAGDLVFIGDTQGYFTAFHGRTGKVLWKMNTGAAGQGISAPAITYLLDGKQQVAVVAGTSLYTFQLIE